MHGQGVEARSESSLTWKLGPSPVECRVRAHAAGVIAVTPGEPSVPGETDRSSQPVSPGVG
jgi:hypothetical protein